MGLVERIDQGLGGAVVDLSVVSIVSLFEQCSR